MYNIIFVLCIYNYIELYIILIMGTKGSHAFYIEVNIFSSRQCTKIFLKSEKIRDDAPKKFRYKRSMEG